MTASKVKARRKSKRTSKYRGVCWIKPRRAWRARIEIRGKREHLGYFDTEEEAARAYDKRAKCSYWSKTRINFPDETNEIMPDSPENFLFPGTKNHTEQASLNVNKGCSILAQNQNNIPLSYNFVAPRRRKENATANINIYPKASQMLEQIYSLSAHSSLNCNVQPSLLSTENTISYYGKPNLTKYLLPTIFPRNLSMLSSPRTSASTVETFSKLERLLPFDLNTANVGQFGPAFNLQ